MAEIKQGRWLAKIEGDFVVFIIGTKVHIAGDRHAGTCVVGVTAG